MTEISRPDKVLFPDPADGSPVTKADLADYYTAVADVMLPHLVGRPLVLHRFPDGVDDAGFFQKQAPRGLPEAAETVTVDADNDRGHVRHLMVGDHDLAPLRATARAARDLFEAIGLTPYLMATGGYGYHVAAPLDGSADFDEARALAVAVADRLVAADPDGLTTRQRKADSGDRIFLDTNRNAYGQTAVAPYSPRAVPGAPVAVPLSFDELGRIEPDGHDVRSVRRRLARRGDPCSGAAGRAAAVARAAAALAAL
ncbi:MAG: ATP-dependent DNA ligase [Pseudonocardia sp.]|uniref:non-homologous end-joining DNA ligase LigD n=1 Tax=unclassified Pseudonocardia TaxID=2619320 RepID=UPI0008683EAE|nr:MULTISPECIES: ATP-dependent DNA ligase [unclassified Pseudonocardia]MBN9107391.1 ATP-dependent DNA ligase [Pseudonocardia sp.]ODU26645.1 MAG: hypothetical protein ABS80_06460 [Pseudonocardia sp. SCN 72-51]ODV06624.1 MAG: hypothetical protein ABT15_12470 [Pseudonocardia sp. SCN 73-27]